MSTEDKLSQLLAKWAFVAEDNILNESALKSAQSLLLTEPGNVVADIFITLALLENGTLFQGKVPSNKCRDHWIAMTAKTTTFKDVTYSYEKQEINLSTLCLFGSVLMGAFLGYSDVPITDMLTSTQEAVRRAAGIPSVV